MNKIEETLWKEYEKANSLIEDLEVGSEKYKEVTKVKDDIMNELLKLEQIEKEAKVKELQVESENKRDKIRNIITVGTFGLSLAFSFWSVKKTFKFDEVATVTSTMGRNILNGVLPKLFKR